MNILLVTDELLSGGVSRYVVDIANTLCERGKSVTVAATDGPYRQQLLSSVRFLPLPLLKENSYKKQIMGFPCSLFILLQHLHDSKYDIIHSQKRYSDMLAHIVSRVYRIPHISTCHSTFVNLKYLSVYGDYTIAVSESIRELLITRYKRDPRKVVTVHNGCNSLRFCSEQEKIAFRKMLRISPQATIIASVGQLIPSKDRFTLLHAISYLKQNNPELLFTLLLVGDGIQRKEIINLIEREQLDPNVLLLPANSDVSLVFNIADFCVLSSVQEGFPYVLLEAASVKKPFIATDVGGVKEFIDHNITGILVPPKNPTLLANAIKELISNEQLRVELGEQAFQKYTAYFNFELFVKRTFDVYDKVLSR